MNWYAVNTKPHQEYLAELALQRLGVETFCPQLRQTKMIRQRLQTVTGPLFPGYLFVRFDLDVHYRAVNYARGVRAVVRFGPDPAVVDSEMIESIKSRLLDGYVIVQPLFSPGQAVRIQEGPLRGLEAIFVQEMSDHQRAVLLLQTLSYQARVVADLEQIAC
jgi:transcriptional antiterminator RfaH